MSKEYFCENEDRIRIGRFIKITTNLSITIEEGFFQGLVEHEKPLSSIESDDDMTKAIKDLKYHITTNDCYLWFNPIIVQELQ